ncbi:MAG TPA: sulfatase, partial [Thermoanaerobaculia bacterium]|nr:sulfatase [Thermoanaerobaculia bacterium]
MGRLLLIFGVVTLLATTWGARPRPAVKLSGPVVIYLVDTLRQDRVSPYGAPRDTTPSAAALAREGIVFENAYSISSWTRPSVATLFTSLLPSEAGTIDRRGVLRDGAPTLAEMLRSFGLSTAAFVANGNVFDRRVGFHRGFDTFVTTAGSPGAPATASEAVDRAVAFVEAQQSPRFFVYVHVIDPHVPYVLAPPYSALFADSPAPATERERLLLSYDRCVRRADDAFGKLADALRKKGFWDEATVLYTSDHGEEFLEHGGLYHGSSLYEEQVRIPLILKLPGAAHAGERRRDAVTLADVVPTMAALAQAPASNGWIGRSLLESGERPLYFTEDLDENRLYAMRVGSSKLIVRLYPTFERRLFDLESDPGEKTGEDLRCDAAVPPRGREAASLLASWRRRDLELYPSLRLVKTGDEPVRVDWELSFLLARRPFLTAEDSCALSPLVKDGALEIHREVR